jgi:hypothetical protein
MCRAEQVQPGKGQLGDTWLQQLEKSVKVLFVSDVERPGSGPDRNFH